MEEINVGLLAAQIFNILLLITWIALALWALFRLRREQMSDTVQVVWAAIILLVPVVGAVAFFIVRPPRGRPSVEPRGR